MLSSRLRSVGSMLGQSSRSSMCSTANFLRTKNQLDNVPVATYSVLCRWSSILRSNADDDVCVRGMCTEKKTWNEALRPKEKKSNIPEEYQPEEVIDKTYHVRDLDLPKEILTQPVKDLGIKEQIVKLQKSGSFVKHLFIGRFDTDFLTYPEILKTRKEFDKVITQCEMIERTFKDTLINPKILKEFGFDLLYRWTVTEMMSVFESMGSAMVIKPMDYNYKQEGQKALKNTAVIDLIKHPSLLSKNHHLIFDIINHNCLSFSAIEFSDNETLRSKMIAMHDDNPDLKIGWAWSERALPFGSADFIDWDSTAQISKDGSSWIINGSKNRILKGDYDYYAIFCKTFDYSEDEDPDWLARDESIPPGIAGFLVPKSMIGVIEDDEVVNGLVFQKIKFDYLNLPANDHLLIDPSPLGIRSQNIQAIGYLGVSAYILGMLKGLMKDTYAYLTKERTPLLECQTMERILCDVTEKIYTVESCLYLTSQAYDSFDNVDADPEMYLEGAICKIIAIEAAHDSLRLLQSALGSEMLITSPAIDFINTLDSYLNNTVFHRVNLGKVGMWMAGYYKNPHIRKLRLGPFFPWYKMKDLVEGLRLLKGVKPKLTMNLCGNVHPSLVDQANELETTVHEFGLAVEWVLKRWAKSSIRRQNDLERAAQIALDIYTSTCVLSRASKAYCDASRNADVDRYLMKNVLSHNCLRDRKLFDQMNDVVDDSDEFRNYYIHKKNIEFNGYFAQSGLHKIRY
ncbi:complex I assembly factor ACAD9, mitochondrial-like isoform X2 [Brevipalpus obovatus]|uniref:complex I assembly factor ACAD9, mitochondrial-like isoform X2 n=1 Tax=Brevipalpus obovatus TaxID=246614 RepID=UPI003D9DED47